MELTQTKLKDLLNYDISTGHLYWRIKPKFSPIDITKPAGCIDQQGYIAIRIAKKGYKAHRLVFLWVDGYWPENGIDHIDHNKQNNKRSNLREASSSCNPRNRSVMSTNKSSITGVCWSKSSLKWQASIKLLGGNDKYLGQYIDIIDAVQARWKAEVKYGFPTCNTISSAYLFLKEHSLL